MNFKTTLALVILLAAGAGLVWTQFALPPRFDPLVEYRPTEVHDAGSLEILAGLKPADFQRVEVQRGKERTILTKAPDGSWVMPGNWPTRSAEVRQLLDQLGQLRSRFAPIAVAEDDLGTYGLASPAVTVVVKTAQGEHRLAFADAPDKEDSTRFDRPSYLRVDDQPEVLQLGPGLVSLLDRPGDYYQQRRLFPVERVAKEEGSAGRVDRLVGSRLEVREGGQLKFALVRGPEGWELNKPYRDALDPRTRDALLEAIPDIWAERFLGADKAKSLDDLGLKSPDRVLAVTRTDGAVVTLEVGKPILEGPPTNSRSYARLKDSNRVFEINSDKLTPVFTTLDALRDNQLARFKTEDAREIELVSMRGKVVFRNTAPPRKPGDANPPKSEWKLVEPVQSGADEAQVDRLLNTLSGLSATDKDVAEKVRLAAATSATTLPAMAGAQASLLSCWLLDPARLAQTFGLAPPAATVKVTVEERKGADKPLAKRTVVIHLGRHDRIGKKLYAQSQDWPRINEISDSLAGLVLEKTSLDYRGRRVLDFLASDVDRLEVHRPIVPYVDVVTLAMMPGYSKLGPILMAIKTATDDRYLALKRTTDGWTLTAPVKTAADAVKVNELADRLGKLDVLTFVADKVPAKELQSKYGLGMPELSVTVTFTDAKKPAKTLHIGKTHAHTGVFARLEGSPEVFAVGSDLVSLLDRDSLAYRPSTLWQVASGDEIVKLKIHKKGQAEYELVRKGDDWQVTGPFTVAAPREVVDKLTAALRSPKTEEYRAHTVTDFAPYGLANPAVQVTLTTKTGKVHSLWVGPETTTGAIGKLARMDGVGPVFVVADVLAKTVDQSALDFLDRKILKFDSSAATSVVRKHGADVLELEKKDDAWQIAKPAEQPADDKTVSDLLRDLGELKAVRVAAYKPKDLKEFGLDNPKATITVKLGGDAKPAEYVLELGKEVAGSGERFAQVKGGQTVAVLGPDAVKKLLAGPLTYRNHFLARVPDADSIKLEAGERKATFAKPEGSWKMTQPLATDADHDALEAFLNSLARLRADELVAEKPTADQLKAFGLDKPGARWQFFSGDKLDLDLSVGGEEKGGRRFARMAGKDLVFVLNAKLSGQLLAEYRPRSVFKDNVDPAQIELVRFGYRKDAFTLSKVDGMWQVVGKPDVKLNATAVSDALSGLRDLKLERYVKDDGAQLKLYGLDPPELVLQATTPTGTVTLHIGGLEGTSRRRYARLPVKGRTDVFVLDETASGKLVRDLAALTKDAK